MDTGVKYQQIQKRFNLGQPLVGWGPFTENNEFTGNDTDFLNLISDGNMNNWYATPEMISSESLTYYKYIHKDVLVSFLGNRTDTLTSYGKDVYQTKQEDFGLICGDSFVSSYR